MPYADRYTVRLNRNSGHWQGIRYPAGTICTAVWNTSRELWDVRMPDGHVIGHTNSDITVIRPV